MFSCVKWTVTTNNKINNVTEVETMDPLQEKLFLELRQTQEEILMSLKNKEKNDWIMEILEEELIDINAAIEKLENGSYGQCDDSGEPLPDHLLKIMPTIKSNKDRETMEYFYRKPISSTFF
jgi:RNA polymerase-binding transcription factor DksA